MKLNFSMDYAMIVSTTENEGIRMESYGLSLTKTQEDGTVENVQILHITHIKNKAEQLLSMVERGLVTPMTIYEVIEDFLED